MYRQWDGGKAAFRFWSKFHQNCSCHSNRKLPLTHNVESDASTLTPSVLIQSLSNLQVMRTGIKSRRSSNFCQIRPLSSELGAVERLKKHRLIMVSPSYHTHFDRIFVKITGNQDRHKISNEFELKPDRISYFRFMRH